MTKLQPITVKIYQSQPNPMQSGASKGEWILSFPPTQQRIDPVMGWTGSKGVQRAPLKFSSKEAALDYARNHGFEAEILPAMHKRRPNIRPLGYAENFQVTRRVPWTH